MKFNRRAESYDCRNTAPGQIIGGAQDAFRSASIKDSSYAHGAAAKEARAIWGEGKARHLAPKLSGEKQ